LTFCAISDSFFPTDYSCIRPEDWQSFQRTLDYVESGETDAHGDRAFDPVHGQAFVQTVNDTFLPETSNNFIKFNTFSTKLKVYL
jgi:hypothetical protein